MDYSLFYNYNLLGDVLMVIIKNDIIPSRVATHDDVTILYDEKEEIVGINIFNISSIIKIKSTGLIVLPVNPIIDVINAKLMALGIMPLPYVNESGFKIGEVLTCVEHEESDHLHVLTVDVKDKILNIVCGAPNVALGQKVVVAMLGTMLFDGSRIMPSKLLGIDSEGMLCSPKELHLATASELRGILVLDANAPVGADFFKIQGGQANG